MYSYEFRPQAIKDLYRLPADVQRKIIKKLDYFMASNKPLTFAHRLINVELGEYRFRVGEYRVIFDVKGEKIIILTLGNRRDVYK